MLLLTLRTTLVCGSATVSANVRKMVHDDGEDGIQHDSYSETEARRDRFVIYIELKPTRAGPAILPISAADSELCALPLPYRVKQ